MKHFKKTSIRMQLLILALLTGLSTVLFIGFFNARITNMLYQQNEQYLVELADQMDASLQQNADELERILYSLSFDEDIATYLAAKTPLEVLEANNKLNTRFLLMRTLKEEITDFIILGQDGQEYYSTGAKPALQTVVRQIPSLEALHKPYYSQCFASLDKGYKQEFFLVAVPFYGSSFGSLEKSSATVIVVVDKHYFSVVPSTPDEGQIVEIYFYDKLGALYYTFALENDSPQENPSMQTLEQAQLTSQEKNAQIFVRPIKGLQGHVAYVTRKETLLSNLVQIQNTIIVLYSFFAILLGILFFITNRAIAGPLKRLTTQVISMRRAPQNLSRHQLQAEGRAEVALLSNEFNVLLRDLDAATQNILENNTLLYERELENKQTEILQLRSQINPHFLYNTLETCKGVAVTEDAPQVFEMLGALGDIFRYSVTGESMVTLEEEIRIVHSYEKLQRIRFGERVHVRYELPEDVLNCFIPKMLLQPLVENAVFHGLEGLTGAGWVLISGTLEKDTTLHIVVQDNGIGCSPEELTRIRHAMEQESQADKIGLLNVHRRIRLQYGQAYGLTIESVQGEGTRVDVTIPINRRQLL